MPITFPTRPYLTYSELQERWKCSENDLRYLIISEGLKPAVKVSEKLTMPDWTYGADEIMAADDLFVAPCSDIATEQPRGWLYLQAPKQIGALECEFRLASNVRNPDKPEDLWDVPSSSWYWLPKIVTCENVKCDAVFLMSEVLHFETMHDHDAVPSKVDAPLGTRERNTLLLIIAALAKAAQININSPSAASAIHGHLDKLDVYIDQRTVTKHIGRIPDALTTRTKLAAR